MAALFPSMYGVLSHSGRTPAASGFLSRSASYSKPHTAFLATRPRSVSLANRRQPYMSSEQRVQPTNATTANTQVSEQAASIEVTTEDGVTFVAVKAKDQGNLLMGLTGVFNTMDLSVLSASVLTSKDGSVADEFRLQTKDGQAVPDDLVPELKSNIEKLIRFSSKSTMPSIYGMVAEAEVKRLKQPGVDIPSLGEAEELELAAAEMAAAAAELVQLERTQISLKANNGADVEEELGQNAQSRQDAAAVLERKMAAMEAILAARRKAPAPPTPEEKAETELPSIMRPPGIDIHKPSTSTGPAAGNGYELIFQGFNWESSKQDWYKVLAGQASDLAAAGYTAVWLPPPSDAVSPQGYLPRDLYDLNSAFGSEAELRDCIAVIKENGMKVIADIVINHRCAHYQSEDGKWNRFGGRLAWGPDAICQNNHEYGGTGSHKTGEDYTAAPNIDHTNEGVRQDITGWLQYLKRVGFDGWRFDYVKGYSGEFSKMYVDATVPEMAFGEFWDTCSYTDGVLNYNQDTHRQRTVNWVDSTGGTCAAFDFTTKGILQEACARTEYWRLVDAQGRPPGFLGMWSSRAITFIENHDTGSTLNHWPFPSNHLHEGYAYIITHPGTPCIFYDHHHSNHDGLGDSIKELLQIRKRSGLHSRSKVHVRKATADVYAATIDDKIAMKIGFGDWSPNRANLGLGEFKLASSGPQFAVWEKV